MARKYVLCMRIMILISLHVCVTEQVCGAGSHNRISNTILSFLTGIYMECVPQFTTVNGPGRPRTLWCEVMGHVGRGCSYPGTLSSLSSHCNSFERVPVDEIYGYPIFKRVTVT